MSPAQTSAPLPECGVCGNPTQREAHAKNGGLCTACKRVASVEAAVGPELARWEAADLSEWQRTVQAHGRPLTPPRRPRR